MHILTQSKKDKMDKLSTENGVISALAIDQRGALKKMVKALGTEPTDEMISDFKVQVSKALTPYASAILLDPEYGLPAAQTRDSEAGLLIAYEKTGYDATKPGRLPDLLDDWSALRIKEAGADAVKFLLYYDADEDAEINHFKHVFIERLGSECVAQDIPFYLEIVTYDANIKDTSSVEFAKIKPHKVIEAMKVFAKTRYHVDVLKVEVPVNMNYVEGYGKDHVYTKDQAKAYFKEQSDATELPFIFLSAGVSAELFQKTLIFANEAHSTFNGVLCGRATWKNGVAPFVEEGKDAVVSWLQAEGKENIEALNHVLHQTANSWHDKVSVQ